MIFVLLILSVGVFTGSTVSSFSSLLPSRSLLEEEKEINAKTSFFYGFFGDFRVAKAPVLELMGMIFRHQKKELKKGVRLYAGIRDPTRPDAGGVPLNKITDSSRNSFSTSVHSSSA